MTSGIQTIVDAYVKLGRIDALTSLRVHRQKLLAGASDRSHFNFSVPREHYERDIAVIDAGLNRVMPQHNWTIRGSVDPLKEKEITGWVQNTQFPDLPVLLGVYLDGELVAEELANGFRPELVEAGIGNGRHGFAFALPPGTHRSVNSLEVRAPYETLIIFTRRP